MTNNIFDEAVENLKVYWDDRVFVPGEVNDVLTDFLVTRLDFTIRTLGEIKSVLDNNVTDPEKVESLKKYFAKGISPEVMLLNTRLLEVSAAGTK